MKIIIQNHNVTIGENLKNDIGQYTGRKSFRIIMPEQDISKETGKIQEIVNAARIGYVKPIIEEE